LKIPEPLSSEFSNSGLIRKNEQSTTQLINLLNTLGISLNAKDAAADDKSKDITNELFLRIKQGTYVCNYEAKELENSNLICKESTYSFFSKDGKILVVFNSVIC
jgi:hypothetical protein